MVRLSDIVARWRKIVSSDYVIASRVKLMKLIISIIMLMMIYSGTVIGDEETAVLNNYYYSAQEYFNAGNIVKAEKEIGKILKINPEHKETLELKNLLDGMKKMIKDNLESGKKSYTAGEYETAKRHFEEALKFEPNNKEAKGYIKKINKAKEEASEEVAESASPEGAGDVSPQKTFVEQLLTAADKKYKEGNYNEAIELYKQVLKSDPKNRKARKIIRNKDKSFANELYKAGVKKYKAGAYQDSINIFIQVVSLDSGNIRAREYLNRATERILDPEKRAVMEERMRLMRDAQAALKEAKAEQAKKAKAIKPLMKSAKREYDRKKYLRATDKFSEIIMKYPDYELASKYYDKIKTDMNYVVKNPQGVNFEALAYARGYNNYYSQNLPEAVNEWEKVLEINSKREEIREYNLRVKEYLLNAEEMRRQKEVADRVERMFNEGVEEYKIRRWIFVINKMESVKSICQKEKFPMSVEWFNKAQDYIKKALDGLREDQLALQIREKQRAQQAAATKPPAVVDEAGSDKAYKEGLVNYAQGKLLEAGQKWEIAMRLNPNNEKAQKALDRLKKEMEFRKQGK